MSKNAVYLAAGVGIGIAAVMAQKLMSPSEVKKEPIEKKGDNAGNGDSKDLFDSDVFAKEQSYQ